MVMETISVDMIESLIEYLKNYEPVEYMRLEVLGYER
jgi:hypothetical protein